MAIAYRSSIYPGFTFVCPRPSLVATGDFMLAKIRSINQTVSGPAGWTQLLSQTATDGTDTLRLSVWYKFAAPAEPSEYQWTGSAGLKYYPTIVVYSGVHPTSPIHANGSGAAVDPWTLGGLTTSIANTFLVAGYATLPVVAASNPAIFTERITEDGDGFYDYLQAASGASASEIINFSPDPATGAGFNLALAPAPATSVTANAGPDQSKAFGALVTLDGTGSTASGTTISSYLWELLSGSAGVTLTGAATSTATCTPSVPGVYEFKLTVTGADGSLDTDTILVTVASAPRAATAFPFSHNLMFEIKESLEYSTRTIESRDVHEQRIGGRRQPRRELEYVVSTHGSVRRLLNSLLWKQGRGPYVLPIWADATLISGGVAAGATSIALDTTAKDYQTGQKAILWQSETNYELVTVTLGSFGAQSITVSAAANTYTGPVVVAPCRTAYLAPDVDTKSLTSNLEHQTLRFRVKWNDEEPVAYNRSDSKYQTNFTTKYKSVELFDLFKLRHDWLEEEGYKAQRYEDEIDHGGAYAWIPRTEGWAQTLSLSATITSRTKFRDLLGWWQYHEGRRVPVWVPTYQDDFKVLSIAGNNVTVEHMNYTTSYALHKARRDVVFIAADGTLTARRITGALDNTTSETLTLDDAPVSGARMSFLPYCRPDHDRLELTYKRWERGGAVEVVLRFQELLWPPS